jgi:hypothetical protein
MDGKMKVGDLVASPGWVAPGLIIKIDKDYHGARQAFKIYKDVPRGQCIRSDMVDGIGPTHRGILDRVLVLWPGYGFSYEDSDTLWIVE